MRRQAGGDGRLRALVEMEGAVFGIEIVEPEDIGRKEIGVN